jgi:REP element-mobilizing transposase RayT
MDRATFESQKAFADEKKPSMQRRCVDNDYTARRMYMVTMVTEGRKQLFGKVVGRSEAIEPSAEAPHIELSPLGKAVEQIWQTIGSHHPEVKVVALQMMPDHLHAILFVKTQMEKTIGEGVAGC